MSTGNARRNGASCRYCPMCGGQTAVLDTRDSSEGVARTRECSHCDFRYKTLEVFAELDDSRRLVISDLKDAARALAAIARIRSIVGEVKV